MAVKIRLTRLGRKKVPYYRIVVADSRMPRDGRFIEQIGHYDPAREPSVIEVDQEKAKQWLAQGAQPSVAVRRLLEVVGLLEKPAPRKKSPRQLAAQKAKGQPQAKAESKAEQTEAKAPEQAAPEEPAPEEAKAEPAAEEKTEEAPAAAEEKSGGEDEGAPSDAGEGDSGSA